MKPSTRWSNFSPGLATLSGQAVTRPLPPLTGLKQPAGAGLPHEGPPRAPACSRPAARAATAMMVRAGLALPWVGSTLPSVM